MNELLYETLGSKPARACRRSSRATPRSVRAEWYWGSLARARSSASCNVMVRGVPSVGELLSAPDCWTSEMAGEDACAKSDAGATPSAKTNSHAVLACLFWNI